MDYKFIRAFIPFIVVFVSFVLVEYPKWKDYSDGYVHIYFFDVGQGDAVLIKDAGRRLFLIDGGPSRHVIHQISKVLPFWVNRIDYVIATHPHADHILGLVYVLRKYEVGCIQYLPNGDPTSFIDTEFRSDIAKSSKTGGQNCINSSGSIEIWQDNTYVLKDNENLNSIVALYTYNDFDVLFTGDAESTIQKKLINNISKDIEIIKVPHHGSKDSFYEPLLQKLRPELGVISVGEGNKFYHPHKETLDGYGSNGIKVFRTDVEGTIHIRSDGYNWEVVKVVFHRDR